MMPEQIRIVIWSVIANGANDPELFEYVHARKVEAWA